MKLLSCCMIFNSLLLLPGCCPYYLNWAQEIMHATPTIDLPIKEVREQAVRTLKIRGDELIHIGLMTKEIIHVLWISDEVVTLHTQLKEYCSGYDHDQTELEQKLYRNQNTTTFLISLYEDNRDHIWSCTLKKNGVTYKATEIKAVELDPYYKTIFGKNAYRYKQFLYRISFDINITEPFEIIFCNGIYQDSVKWP